MVTNSVNTAFYWFKAIMVHLVQQTLECVVDLSKPRITAPQDESQNVTSPSQTSTVETTPRDESAANASSCCCDAASAHKLSDSDDTASSDTVVLTDHSSDSLSIEEESSSVRPGDNVKQEMPNLGLHDKYTVDESRRLGTGTNTIVRPCVDRATAERFAVKTVRKSRRKEYQSMRQEAQVLSRLDHPCIIKLQDVCQDDDEFNIVFEKCKGGEVFDLVSGEQERCSTVNEDMAVKIVHQVVQAIAYCHSQDYIHRDVKLENVLLKKSKKHGSMEIRLIDFGLAIRHSELDAPLTDYVGSPYYVAPELLNRCYGKACDVWSLGVMTYALLCGDAPFNGAGKPQLFRNICRAPLEFSHPAWKTNISRKAKSFVQACLEKDPKKRPTAEELLQHEWFACQSLPSRMGKVKGFFRSKKQ